MSNPQTLLQLSGADLSPASLGASCLILIDMQNEYLEGPVTVPDAREAISQAHMLLEKARTAGTPVIHVAHKGKVGSLFDRDGERGQFVSELTPQAGEKIIEKGLPNAFANTDLLETLNATGRKDVIICGFMTHMCVSSTARAALDLGFRVTIDADSCGTRDLPDGRGGVVNARNLHEISLVALSDRFAVIARDHEWQS